MSAKPRTLVATNTMSGGNWLGSIENEKRKRVRIGYWPSHTRFVDLIDFCVHGESRAFQTRAADHIAELCMLMHGDIDRFLWHKKSPREGITVRKIVDALTERIRSNKDLAAAEMLYAIATYSTFEILTLYLRNAEIFKRITPHRTILPCVLSIHPNSAKVTAAMRRDAGLGTRSWESQFIGSRPWFTSDAPANVYARAVIKGVELNQRLDSIEEQQKSWKRFDRENGVRTQVLPFPRYVDGIDQLPVPIAPQTVSQYWQKGKEMILEELPDFHLRPEWQTYHRRHYKNGAKRGAVQHAIFKDILAALKTIAGANRRSGGR